MMSRAAAAICGLAVAVFALATATAMAQPPPPAQVPPPAVQQAPPPLPPPTTSSTLVQPMPVDPFQFRVNTAAAMLDNDPQAALEALDHLAVESIELRRTRALTDAERPAHRQLFVLRARGHVQLLNNEKVRESYLELLRVDPFFSAQLPPREEESLDAVRRADTGLLEINSPVRDCRIILDGLDIGATGDSPVRVSLVTGTYQLRLEKPGHQAAGARIILAAGQTLTLNDLAPKPQIPPVAFLVDREGVEVVVDGAPAGQSIRLNDLKGKISALEAAALDQAVTLARFDPATTAAFLLVNPPVDKTVGLRFKGGCLIEESRTVSITAQALAALDPASPLVWFGDSSAVRMRPDIGTLRISSTPADADVYIDGAMVGRTPFERSVCSGEHRLRVRHRIGSYAVSAVVIRGRTEVVDVTLKPGLAFLGAIETVQNTLRPSSDLTSTVDRAFALSVRSFRLAPAIDLPLQLARWTEASTAQLVAASDKGDDDSVQRLLKQASENFDAPVLVAAVGRGPADSPDTPVDILVFWYEHPGVDRVRVPKATSGALADILDQFDRPADPAQLVYQNDLGMRVADTLLPEAPLLIVAVEPGSPGAIAGLKPGDGITAIDGSALTATQLAERVREKRPGDVLSLRLSGSGPGSKQLAVPIQRRPKRAGAFDPTAFGNALMAKLNAASALAAGAADRDLLAFNMALIHMRFGQWKQALNVFNTLSQIPIGAGVGPGAALYFRARCHLEIGEKDRAMALLREASMIDGQTLADDGSSVAALAKLRLSALGKLPRFRWSGNISSAAGLRHSRVDGCLSRRTGLCLPSAERLPHSPALVSTRPAGGNGPHYAAIYAGSAARPRPKCSSSRALSSQSCSQSR